MEQGERSEGYRHMGKRNGAKLERSKVEKLSVTNSSRLCESNKTYWVGAASGGMFFCRVRVSRLWWVKGYFT